MIGPQRDALWTADGSVRGCGEPGWRGGGARFGQDAVDDAVLGVEPAETEVPEPPEPPDVLDVPAVLVLPDEPAEEPPDEPSDDVAEDEDAPSDAPALPDPGAVFPALRESLR